MEHFLPQSGEVVGQLQINLRCNNECLDKVRGTSIEKYYIIRIKELEKAIVILKKEGFK